MLKSRCNDFNAECFPLGKHPPFPDMCYLLVVKLLVSATQVIRCQCISNTCAKGCLASPKSAPQDLCPTRGADLSPLQLKRSMIIKKKSANAVLNNNVCASLLEKSAWHDTEAGNGFFYYCIKKKGLLRNGIQCNQQFLSTDLQAIFYMAQHGISCSLDRQGLLQLNVPRDKGNGIIRVDCKARRIDLNFYNNTLRVATFEDDGSTYLVTADKQGSLGSGIARVVDGISPKKLANLKKRISETSALKNFSGTPKKFFIAGTGAAITGVTAALLHKFC